MEGAQKQEEMFPCMSRTRKGKVGPVILREKITELEAADKSKKETEKESELQNIRNEILGKK